VSQIKVTLIIDIPDNARVSTPDVDYEDGRAGAARQAQAAAIPHAAADEPELPPIELLMKGGFEASEIGAPTPITEPRCPQHGAMKRYPAGVSKKTGKPFNGSWRCEARDCSTKPVWDKDAA
jgi:hypothetical protein